jgi:hypothetical protein
MSEGDPDEGAIDVAEFTGRLEALESGTLDPSGIDELMGRLNRSRAARQLYLDYFKDSAILREIAKTLDAQGKMPVAVDALASRRAFRRSVMAAAAIVILSGLIAAMIQIGKPRPPVVSSAAVAGTQWTVDGVARNANEEEWTLRPGTTLRVDSGSVRLEQESGTAMVIQGPAELAFPSLDQPQLRSGWLWIDAGADGAAIAVHAPGLLVRDIGTRFGVRVPQEGPVEVHLIEGRVQVLAADGGRLLGDFRTAGKAHTVTAEGKVEEAPLASDPFPAMPGLLVKPANYRTTLLSQSPAGYWPLDEASGGDLGNEIVRSSVGIPGQAVRGGEPGVELPAGGGGFPPGNRSVYLDGSPDRSAVVGLDGLHGVSRREGAVSFWIRRPVGATRRDETLWLAGLGDEESLAPTRAILQTRITAVGRVVFEIENGDADVYLSSSRSVADGRWHQVTASWGPSSVDLYVDGQLIGRDIETRTLEEGNFSGRFVRFGKPSRDLQSEMHAFTGWVDEIALWDRPLSPAEVACQFEAALGSAAGK